MKKTLLFLTFLLPLIISCETAEPEYFIDDDLVVVRVHNIQPTASQAMVRGKSFSLRRVKNPNMVAVVPEDGLRTMCHQISYRTGDTIRVAFIDRALFGYTGK